MEFHSNGQKIDNASQTWSGKRRSSDDIHRKYIYRTQARTIMDESDTPYDLDEMPSYSYPSPNSPVINGQRNTEIELSGQESENMGISTKQIQSPDFHNRANELTTDMDEMYDQQTNILSVEQAKLRKRKPEESLRDFGQAIEDLYRRAYPGNPEIVEENSIKAFLDKCGQSEDFRLSVKRTRPNTLQEAVINSMQEECLRVGEKDLAKHFKPVQRPIFEVEDGDSDEDVPAVAEETQRENVDRNNVPDNYPRNNGIGSHGFILYGKRKHNHTLRTIWNASKR
ncbi:unnamed protein product [Mytilus coruscus]|uniref:Uncharacterized protein n=1 Tax=Mytilus coruscus TaxID=42192 RepID=A0A6J8E434_MYTCO|nr:unnamed protein product [Mytilus coruscus]